MASTIDSFYFNRREGIAIMKMIISNPGRLEEERELTIIPENQAKGASAAVTDQRDQAMLGFGAALTDAACVMINRMPEPERNALLEEIYAPDKGNFSVGRVCVGSSDYAEVPYNFAPVADDLTMQYFDASHDDANILPVLRKARAYNPYLFLYSSPWSPPGWMKTSGQLQGGFIRQKYIKAYALYYLKFIQYYMKNGIRLNGLTPQNESETDQQSRMPACIWHPELEMEFALEMRKLLDENGFEDIKIWLMDHNFVMWRRAAFQMSDPDVRKACAGVAWHPYEGHPEMVGWFRRQYPDAENHWTEGDIVPIDFSAIGHMEKSMGKIAEGFLQSIAQGIQSITLWNLALDPKGYPNIGPFDCRGIFEISRDGKSVTPSMEYHVLRHFTKYVKRGARRVILEREAMPRNFSVEAFENPDGQIVAVISNTEKFDSDFNLCAGGKCIPLHILRQSVSTVLL